MIVAEVFWFNVSLLSCLCSSCESRWRLCRMFSSGDFKLEKNTSSLWKVSHLPWMEAFYSSWINLSCAHAVNFIRYGGVVVRIERFHFNSLISSLTSRTKKIWINAPPESLQFVTIKNNYYTNSDSRLCVPCLVVVIVLFHIAAVAVAQVMADVRNVAMKLH